LGKRYKGIEALYSVRDKTEGQPRALQEEKKKRRRWNERAGKSFLSVRKVNEVYQKKGRVTYDTEKSCGAKKKKEYNRKDRTEVLKQDSRRQSSN